MEVEKFYLLQEFSDKVGLNPATVANYAKKGLLTFVKGRHHRFGNQAIKDLEKINELKANGYSLEMIKKYFDKIKNK